MKKSLRVWLLVPALLILSSSTHASYSNLFIFGDSLSDSGNNAFALQQTTPTPISDNSFIATYPYASGQYTNGQVWAQDLASALGLSAAPSLLGGTDYAFGGATTGPVSADPFNPYPPSLETQVGMFLGQSGGSAPSNALYVVAGGANDAFYAMNTMGACSGSPAAVNACINGIIVNTVTNYVTNIETIVSELESAGAKDIVVWNVPDIGVTPAILSSGASAAQLGTLFALTMNAALTSALANQNVDIFNFFGLVDNMVFNPANYGLTNVTDACAQFVNCDPSQYVFWDGIHPTSAGQQIISNAMLDLVSIPEPSSLFLLALGLAGLRFNVRKTD